MRPGPTTSSDDATLTGIFININKKPIGATIHEMDEYIDHGPIICQEKIEILPNDTSSTLYYRIQQLEIKLFKKHIESIIKGNYLTSLVRAIIVCL